MKASPQSLFAAGASIMVLAVIAVGLFLNGSPADVRRQRLDQQRVADLRAISNGIDEQWSTQNRLPENLAALGNNPRLSYLRTSDPDTEVAYEYRVTGPQTFELCGVFETKSVDPSTMPWGSGVFDLNSPFWHHEQGRHCFLFTVPLRDR
jgi:hypothetical protein